MQKSKALQNVYYITYKNNVDSHINQALSRQSH